MATREEERITGRVKWYSSRKGYGFIATDGPDVFVHRSEIKGYNKELEEGQEVEFETVKGPKGLKAIDVIVI